jgi:hypothetical protein
MFPIVWIFKKPVESSFHQFIYWATKVEILLNISILSLFLIYFFTIKAKTGVRCHTFRFRCYPQIGHQITHHCHPTYRPYPGKSLALIMENRNKLFQSNLYNKKCKSSIVNDRSFPSVERPSRTRPAVPLLSPPVHNFRLEIKSPKYQSLTP